MFNKESDDHVPPKKIAPSRLVGRVPNKMEDFFLVLAVIYNDLKGLVHLEKDYVDNHELPTSEVPSSYLGEYNGMVTQSYKILAGLMHEFFEFLRHHENLYQHPQFMLLVRKLPPDMKAEWESILNAALERPAGKRQDSFGRKLMLIRNNVAFHYYQSEEVLRAAFQDFFADETNPTANYAYYSFGDTMEGTRFYYADAATQRYLMETGSEQTEVDYVSHIQAFRRFQTETFTLVGKMNRVLANLLRHYIQTRHGARI